MKLAYLTTITQKLLLSIIVMTGLSGFCYRDQMCAEVLDLSNLTKSQLKVLGLSNLDEEEVEELNEQGLVLEEMQAYNVVRTFLRNKKSPVMSWRRFVEELTAKLARLPQYVSFCADLKKIANISRLDLIPYINQPQESPIAKALRKYQPLLPLPIQKELEREQPVFSTILLNSYSAPN